MSDVIVIIRPMASSLDVRLPMPLSGAIFFRGPMQPTGLFIPCGGFCRPSEFIRSVHFEVPYAAA